MLKSLSQFPEKWNVYFESLFDFSQIYSVFLFKKFHNYPASERTPPTQLVEEERWKEERWKGCLQLVGGGLPNHCLSLLLCSSIHSQLTHQHRGRKQTVYGLYVSSVCVSFPSFICHQDVCYVSCGLWSAIYNTITLMSLFITIDFWLDND